MGSKYAIQAQLEVPDSICQNWQLMVDMLARQLDIPVALIMRAHAREIEVAVASQSEGNVYHRHERAPLDSGLYCETVMDRQAPLMVTNALAEPVWCGNPDISRGMVAYLGLPLSWPTGEVFGTLCVLDSRANPFNGDHMALMRIFQDSIVQNLAVIHDRQHESSLRQHVQGDLNKTQAYVRTLIDASPDLIWLKNEQSVYLACNKRYGRYLGAPEDHIVGRPDTDFISQQAADAFRRKDEEAIHRGRSYVTEEEVVYADDGHKELMETVRTPIYDPDSGQLMGVLGVARDITERKRYEQQIYLRAYYDDLTGLPNRSYILDCLAKLISAAEHTDRRVALLFIDLDGFKMINDTLGHEIGDLLLVQATDRLKHSLESTDTVGRLGGDEFIVLLDGLGHASQANAVVDKLIRQFQAPFRIQGQDLVLTASIGVSVYPDDGIDPSELLRSADVAMYHAKDKGRNTYSRFNSAMNHNLLRRLQIETQMRTALERHEFTLRYQVIVELASGRVAGVETLLRWHNDKLGEVSPSEFIPIAEQSGLILTIGQYVLREALAQQKSWARISGLEDFKVAVNISPRQLRDVGFCDMLRGMLEAADVPPHCLGLEITEGVLMSGYAEIGNMLNRLSELGVCIAMDDFGTGYSSLSYVRKYPFATLKIDQEFVSEIVSKPDDLNLLGGIILMAHGMGLRVIAEGVESAEQRNLLADLQCDYVQGNFFSRAVTADAVSRMLAAPDAVLAP